MRPTDGRSGVLGVKRRFFGARRRRGFRAQHRNGSTRASADRRLPGVPKAVGGDNSDIGAFELQPTHHTRGTMNPHTNIRGATIGGATALLAIALVAFAALLMPHVAGASKERTRTVDATMKVAIIEQTEGANHFAGSITGKPGVCLVTAGPGGLNSMAGVAQAYGAASPMVHIGGAVPLKADMEALGSASLADVMRFVPGVNIEAIGREGALTSIMPASCAMSG